MKEPKQSAKILAEQDREWHGYLRRCHEKYYAYEQAGYDVLGMMPMLIFKVGKKLYQRTGKRIS